ncbi:MAG: hypothetical protein ABI216_07425 [Devosia sp.]
MMVNISPANDDPNKDLMAAISKALGSVPNGKSIVEKLKSCSSGEGASLDECVAAALADTAK